VTTVFRLQRSKFFDSYLHFRESIFPLFTTAGQEKYQLKEYGNGND
jgi:hypothetical protein